MRTRIVIPILIILVVALAIIFLVRPAQSPDNGKQPPQSLQNTQALTANAKATQQGSSNNAPVSASSPTNLTIIESPLHKQLQTPEGFQQYVNEKNIPIDFFGQFIDQDSNALAGVDIKILVRHWTMPIAFQAGTKDIPLEQKSGTDGRFEITGASGDVFSIESIQKDGYELEPGQRTFGASIGSSANPVIFKMWSTNIHEQLITGEKSFEILPDGKPHVIDLTKGTIAEAGNGDLKVWIQYTNQATRGQLYDWSAGIEVNNGGLLEEPHGAAMYSAPTDGYTNSFQLQQQIKGGQSGEIGDRSFYLKLNNGQTYGRININLYAPYGRLHPGLIRISYAINPSGSRILR